MNNMGKGLTEKIVGKTALGVAVLGSLMGNGCTTKGQAYRDSVGYALTGAVINHGVKGALDPSASNINIYNSQQDEDPYVYNLDGSIAYRKGSERHLRELDNTRRNERNRMNNSDESNENTVEIYELINLDSGETENRINGWENYTDYCVEMVYNDLFPEKGYLVMRKDSEGNVILLEKIQEKIWGGKLWIKRNKSAEEGGRGFSHEKLWNKKE